jgi:hypothetical protein
MSAAEALLLDVLAAVMRGPKRIDLKKIVDKGLELAKRSAEVSSTTTISEQSR